MRYFPIVTVLTLILVGPFTAVNTLGLEAEDAPVCNVSMNDVGRGPILLAQLSLACGIAPIPPIGCKVGACVCDQNGQNCQWTFICQ